MTKRYDCQGTPLYISLESFLVGEIKGCLGCVVVEMISGRPAWDCTSGMDDLVIQITTKVFCMGPNRKMDEVPPPLGFGPISKRPSLPKTLPPPLGFESISRKPTFRKNLPPPGIRSKRILA
ncbi:hypothetical protein FH972_010591 [Carpinus fangiana]|uniref:Protein kinase domain-containing protein n=1 Tax=Carpinus fangiana TaxID=176857 RepID=A0A660KRX0_9ROSI|nr:hypothetical protein FH972_010591 [Carpinus fangiana]